MYQLVQRYTKIICEETGKPMEVNYGNLLREKAIDFRKEISHLNRKSNGVVTFARKA